MQTPNAANGFRQQTEQKRSKQFFRGGTVRVGVLYLLHELKVLHELKDMAGKRKRFEEAERQRKERGNGEDAATVLTVFLREMRQKAEELMQQSEMAGAASVLAGLSAQARVVVGEWGADEIDVDLEEEAQEGGGDCNTFDLASSVLEELGEGGNGEDE